MSERLAALPTDKYERLRETLEELARRRQMGDLTVREAAQKLTEQAAKAFAEQVKPGIEAALNATKDEPRAPAEE